MTIANFKKPVVISTCSGIGGFDKGAKLAGFECIYQSDIAESVEKVFYLNDYNNSLFPQSDYRTNDGIFERKSIEAITFESIKAILQKESGLVIKRGDIDLYISGSPCQDLSAINRFRSNFAYRSKLMFDQYRIADALKVKVGVFENVAGLLDNYMSDFRAELNTVLSKLEKDYYILQGVLNAKDYSSRQDRPRVIILIVRKDVGALPWFPASIPIDHANYMHNLFPTVTHYFTKANSVVVSTYFKILVL